jgi:hypothetical protein
MGSSRRFICCKDSLLMRGYAGDSTDIRQALFTALPAFDAK